MVLLFVCRIHTKQCSYPVTAIKLEKTVIRKAVIEIHVIVCELAGKLPESKLELRILLLVRCCVDITAQDWRSDVSRLSCLFLLKTTVNYHILMGFYLWNLISTLYRVRMETWKKFGNVCVGINTSPCSPGCKKFCRVVGFQVRQDVFYQ